MTADDKTSNLRETDNDTGLAVDAGFKRPVFSCDANENNADGHKTMAELVGYEANGDSSIMTKDGGPTYFRTHLKRGEEPLYRLKR